MRRRCTTALASVLLLTVFALPASADVTLPCVFSDHMVLQRDEPGGSLGMGRRGRERHRDDRRADLFDEGRY